MFKFYLNKLLSSKYILKGKCKQCGQCCRSITFRIGKELISEEVQWQKLKEWDKRYEHFYISGRDVDGALLFACKSLDENNKCTKYFFRSLFCRCYPFINAGIFGQNHKTLDGCGYSIGVSKKFNDYLNPIEPK